MFLVTAALMSTCFGVIWFLSFCASELTDKAHDKMMNKEAGAMGFYYGVKVKIKIKFIFLGSLYVDSSKHCTF